MYKRQVALLLRLNFVPMGKAVKPLVLVIIGEIEIEICGVKLLVDLFVEDVYKRQSLCPVRLACVKHAASVRPEPGSNS